MKIGACGAGTIVSWVSNILGQLADPDIELYAVAGRNLAKAEAFAEKYGYKRAYGSYEELIEDPDVDVVYIGVPNQLHKDLCLKAAASGKNIVVEKPFAINLAEAELMIESAREKGVFICEGLWTAFLPSRRIVDDIIGSGRIGTLTGGKFVRKTNVMFLERVQHLETGGGALLDMGPYFLSRATDHFGCDFESVEGRFEMLPTGVDSRDYYTITYPGGVKIECISTIDSPPEEEESYCIIEGTEGSIYMDQVNCPSLIEVRDREGHVIDRPALPPLISNTEPPYTSGYEHIWIAVEKALREGKKETDEAPVAMTLAVSAMMTELRKQAGIVFPFE